MDKKKNKLSPPRAYILDEDGRVYVDILDRYENRTDKLIKKEKARFRAHQLNSETIIWSDTLLSDEVDEVDEQSQQIEFDIWEASIDK